eukprot:scaffold104648_cov61-Phaeocystis_antarctica.AAC.6
MSAWSGGAEAQGQARVQVHARAVMLWRRLGADLGVESLGSRFLRSRRGWGRTERVEPRVGGLRWYAMRVGRLLRRCRVAQVHRVAGSQGGVAGRQAGWVAAAWH